MKGECPALVRLGLQRVRSGGYRDIVGKHFVADGVFYGGGEPCIATVVAPHLVQALSSAAYAARP